MKRGQKYILFSHTPARKHTQISSQDVLQQKVSTKDDGVQYISFSDKDGVANNTIQNENTASLPYSESLQENISLSTEEGFDDTFIETNKRSEQDEYKQKINNILSSEFTSPFSGFKGSNGKFVTTGIIVFFVLALLFAPNPNLASVGEITFKKPNFDGLSLSNNAVVKQIFSSDEIANASEEELNTDTNLTPVQDSVQSSTKSVDESSKDSDTGKRTFFGLKTDFDFRIKLPDLSWIFEPSEEDPLENTVFNTFDTPVEDAQSTINDISTQFGIPGVEGFNTQSTISEGTVIIKKGLSDDIYSGVFDKGDDVLITYNDIQVRTTIDAETVSDKNTVLVISEDAAEELFGISGDDTLKNVTVEKI